MLFGGGFDTLGAFLQLCGRKRRWRKGKSCASGVKGTKFTKSDLVNANNTGFLQITEGHNALNKPQIISLIDNYAGSVNYSKNIQTVDDILEFFRDTDNWFTMTFKQFNNV